MFSDLARLNRNAFIGRVGVLPFGVMAIVGTVVTALSGGEWRALLTRDFVILLVSAVIGLGVVGGGLFGLGMWAFYRFLTSGRDGTS